MPRAKGHHVPTKSWWWFKLLIQLYKDLCDVRVATAMSPGPYRLVTFQNSIIPGTLLYLSSPGKILCVFLPLLRWPQEITIYVSVSGVRILKGRGCWTISWGEKQLRNPHKPDERSTLPLAKSMLPFLAPPSSQSIPQHAPLGRFLNGPPEAFTHPLVLTCAGIHLSWDLHVSIKDHGGVSWWLLNGFYSWIRIMLQRFDSQLQYLLVLIRSNLIFKAWDPFKAFQSHMVLCNSKYLANQRCAAQTSKPGGHFSM